MEDIIKDVTEDTPLAEDIEDVVTAVNDEPSDDEPSDDETVADKDVEDPAETKPVEPEPTVEVLSPLQSLMKSGLSEREATLVLNDREMRRTSTLPPSDSLPRMAHSPRLNISYGELMQMKEIFEGLSDSEINRLYNKVTN